MSISYAYILINYKKRKRYIPSCFSHEMYYILSYIDNGYLSPKACHHNIGALEIKPLSLLLVYLAKACKLINTCLQKILTRFINIIL